MNDEYNQEEDRDMENSQADQADEQKKEHSGKDVNGLPLDRFEGADPGEFREDATTY